MVLFDVVSNNVLAVGMWDFSSTVPAGVGLTLGDGPGATLGGGSSFILDPGLFIRISVSCWMVLVWHFFFHKDGMTFLMFWSNSSMETKVWSICKIFGTL